MLLVLQNNLYLNHLVCQFLLQRCFEQEVDILVLKVMVSRPELMELSMADTQGLVVDKLVAN